MLLLDPFKDTPSPDGYCAGCDIPACLVLNEIDLFQTVGASGSDIYILNAPGLRQGITWNGGTVQFGGLCPALIDPVKSRTWGSVKATYR